MAIYHLSAKSPISRAAGRSATAAAAYRSGTRITDERTGVAHDYSKRKGVLASRLVLPGGQEISDRAKFWNQVERHHRRSDAVVAREVIIALPVELKEEERRLLAFRFASEIALEFQVAVDCCVHAASGKGDKRNEHAHLLLSACTAATDGSLGKKASRLDPIYCSRQKLPDSVAWFRPRWEDLVNDALKKLGCESRVNHRSHRAQGLPQIPSIHVGFGAGRGRRARANAKVRLANEDIRQTALGISRLLEERRRLQHVARRLATEGKVPRVVRTNFARRQ